MNAFASLRWIFFGLLLLVHNSQAKSSIENVSIFVKDQTVYADVISDIKIGSAVIEAINSGITLVFSYEFEIKTPRWYPTQPLAVVRKHYHLSYSRMTGKYQIDNPVTLDRETFSNLPSAISFMQTLRQFPLLLVSQIPDEPMVVAVRFYLTPQHLPSYVRVERLFNNAWDADSDWTTWSISDDNLSPQ